MATMMERVSTDSDPFLRSRAPSHDGWPHTMIPESTSVDDPSVNVSSRYPSLARSSPRILSVLIPLLACLAHALFLYGQTAPMWRLRLSQHVDAWANATTTQTKWAFDSIGIPHQNAFYVQQDMDVETFTYGYAVRQLWRAKGIPGTKLLPRMAAILLTLFSGVWPHLKLFLLNITWLMPSTHPAFRTRTLRWLSALGKWSLADVLAVCVMVGVLNLDWQVQPAEIQDGLLRELPTVLTLLQGAYKPVQLCSLLLHYKCDRHTPIDRKVKCGACQSLVSEAFTHPSWAQSTGKEIVKGVATSGGGMVKLRVVGMRGIYAFCDAVVLSIFLSLLVDIMDNRARRARTKEEQAPVVDSMQPQDDTTVTLDHESPTAERQYPLHLCRRILLLIAALVTTVIVYFAIITPCMERKVDGAIPILLQQILGVDWKRTYSLRGLVITTGAAGAWDILLMRTFNLFVVFGPVTRSLLCILGLIVPSRLRRIVLWIVDLVGAFCAWEVFTIAMFMVDMLMPSITDTIYNNPSCAQVTEDGSCLHVEFNVLRSFFLLVLGGALLLAVSGITVRSKVIKEVTPHHDDYIRLNHDEEMESGTASINNTNT